MTEHKRSSSSTETALLLELLSTVDELHTVTSEMHACMKQGFFNMTKARISGGSGASMGGTRVISVLDAREELKGTVTVGIRPLHSDTDEISSLMDGLGINAGHTYRIEREGAGGGRSTHTNDNQKGRTPPGNLRQRGSTHAADLGSSTLSPRADPASMSPETDTLQLFGGGLVPPPLRKAKKNFGSAVDCAFVVASLTQRVLQLQSAIEECQRRKQSFSTNTNGKTHDTEQESSTSKSTVLGGE